MNSVFICVWVSVYYVIGVIGLPKQDISSLGAMGWGLEVAGNSSVVVATVQAWVPGEGPGPRALR